MPRHLTGPGYMRLKDKPSPAPKPQPSLALKMRKKIPPITIRNSTATFQTLDRILIFSDQMVPNRV